MIWREPARGSLPDPGFFSLAGIDQARALLRGEVPRPRRQLETWKGKEVKTTGDGFLATFDSPARAVQCARATRDAVRRLGLEIRAGTDRGHHELKGVEGKWALFAVCD